ncbi:MAG: hypothetical protein ACTSX7_08885 [Alphaproteobacteria bacterium]
MMLRISVLAAVAILALPDASFGQSQPSSDWNGNFNFRSQAERSNDLIQADLVERGSSNYYGQWTQSYTGTTTVTNYSTTEIAEQEIYDESTNYMTSNVGSITTTDIEGDNNNLNTSNENCGQVSGSVVMDGGTAGGPSSGGAC